MNRKRQRAPSLKVLVLGSTLLLLAPIARAAEVEPTDPMHTRLGDFSSKIEPSLVIPLSDPQAELFHLTERLTVKTFWAMTRYLDVGPSLTYIAMPSDKTKDVLGTAWTFGASLRVKRSHDVPEDAAFFAISPWLDADALYVRTGDLNRAGFAVAVGMSVPIGERRNYWLGPFVRYLHILQQPERIGFDNHDAKVLLVGLSLEIGNGVRREPAAVVASNAEGRTVTKATYYCPDRDNDTVPDHVDHCPDVAGPMDNWGCPLYQKIIVKKDKIELKERIYFAWDQAVILDASFPVLDEVAQALKDNKGFRVQVEGHASSEGGDDHNQTLSEKRAEAVLDYLAAHGIKVERLKSRGFGSSVPADTNTTLAGRENNRRVEFVVYFIIVDEGSK